MNKKILLNKQTQRKLLSQNKSIKFGWESNLDEGIIFRNRNLGVTLYYFGVFNKSNDYFEYDTFGIEEREGNCVSVVLNQKNEIGLLKEYRFMPDKHFLSCPRGFSDFQNENRLDCALREIKEEIGDFKVIEVIDLGNLYQNTTFFLNSIGVKLVKIEIDKKIEISGEQKSEDIIDVVFYNPEIVKKMINDGKIECLMTLGALSKYFAYIENR